MRLYLVQHGEALAKEVDPQRPLSDTGHTDISRLADFLKAAGIQVSRVIHSGKKRAQQTAGLLANSLTSGLSAEESPGLGPNDSPEKFAEQIANWKLDTLVVSHLPFLDRLLAHQVLGKPDDVVSFRPGTVICLQRSEPEGWRIAWMLRPELLRNRDLR